MECACAWPNSLATSPPAPLKLPGSPFIALIVAELAVLLQIRVLREDFEITIVECHLDQAVHIQPHQAAVPHCRQAKGERDAGSLAEERAPRRSDIGRRLWRLFWRRVWRGLGRGFERMGKVPGSRHAVPAGTPAAAELLQPACITAQLPFAVDDAGIHVVDALAELVKEDGHLAVQKDEPSYPIPSLVVVQEQQSQQLAVLEPAVKVILISRELVEHDREPR